MQKGLEKRNIINNVIVVVLMALIISVGDVEIVRASSELNSDLSGKCGEDAYWMLDASGNMYITGSGEIVHDKLWETCEVKSVEICEGITDIGWHAFDGCGSLTSVSIPTGVTGIGECAFYRCSSLTNVSIPESVTIIENEAFGGCSSLTNVRIPEGVTSISDYVFYSCSSLTSVNIPEGVISIGKYAFAGCSNLKSVNIPKEVTNIGERAFSECSSLTSVSIPEGVTNIEVGVFEYCSSLTNVSIPKGVTSIEVGAFGNCSSLASVNIPEGVMNIRGYAFSNCRSLASVSIPEGVTSIGQGVFSGCRSLTSVKIPKRITSIGEYAFGNCISLTSMILPEGVTSIGEYAFDGCSSLTSVKIQGNAPQEVSGNSFNDTNEKLSFYVSEGATGFDVEPWSNYRVVYGEGTYVLTYDANGGNNAPASQKKTSGKALTLSKSIPTRTGYTFLGWAIDKTASQASYKAGSTFKIDKDTTLYAVWKPISYKVAFHANGGSGKMSTVSRTYGKAAELPANTFTRTGYRFNGWNKKADGSGTAYTDKSSIKNLTSSAGSTVILYAQWAKAKYTITYNLNGGKNNTKNPSSYYITTATITLQNPTRTGYTFKGWYADSTYKTKVTRIAKGSTGARKLYAKWSPNLYTIRYDKNGGTGNMSDSKSLKYGTEYTLRANTFQRRGYTFAGWATARDGAVAYKNNAKVKNLSSKNGAVKILYAKWTKTKYTITYNLNGGKNSTKNPASYNITTATITLQNPTRTGYTFKGWYADSTYKTKVTQIAKGSTGARKLYAKWSPNLYTVRYDKNGGTGSMSDSKSLKYGTEYTLRTNTFQRKGYTFAGWAAAKDGKVSYKDKARVKNLSSKNGAVKVLYAKWTPIKYTITYNLNGGKNSTKNPASYYVTTATIILQNPTRTGYTFKGWYADSKYKTKVTQIAKGNTGTKKLYAKWSLNTYTVRYDKNGGTGSMSDSTSLKYGTEYTLRANVFQKKGYIFAGWATAKDGKVVYQDKARVKNLSSTNGAVKVLYAQWKPEAKSITLSADTAEITVGESMQLTAVVAPDNAADKTVTWSSNNKAVAVVSDGTVTGKAAGTAVITAKTSNHITAECTVTVKEAAVPAQSISLNQSTLLLKKGEAAQLSAEILPDDVADKTVTWASADHAVAAVNAEGVVEGVGDGTTDITASTANGLKAVCTVTVQSAISISNAEELKAIANNLSGNYELISDIELGGEEWTPIGQDNTAPFSGTLEGNGYSITGLSITDASQVYSGLFGYCSGTVQNLTVSGTISATGSNGNSYRYAGGIAGFANKAAINQCVNQVGIQISNRNETMGTYVYAGGIAGAIDSYTSLTACRNEADIMAEAPQGTRADAMAGGIVGNAISDCVIESCENTGRISASAATTFTKYFITSCSGGIAGAAGLSKINACVNRGEIYAEGTLSEATAYDSMVLAGGIAGHSSRNGLVNGENFADNIQAAGSELIPMIYQDPVVAFSLE